MNDKTDTYSQNLPPDLVAEVAAMCSRTVPPGLSVLTDALRSRFGQGLKAILLYGSCLHNDNITDGVVDLYVLVDNYRDSHQQRLLQILNAILPPNVFYLEVQNQGHTLRTKYAVISLEDFEKAASRWFHSYIWARFAQPARLLYTQDEASRSRVNRALAQAVMTFLDCSIPALGSCDTDTETIWTQGLTLTYAAELRPELHKTRARQLVHLNMSDYITLTSCAAAALKTRPQVLPQGRYRCEISASDQRRSLRQWRLRRWQGRVLSILRLIKAALTFRDGVDYAAWKIERHTGISIDVTPGLRRYPLLLGPRVLWKLLRRRTLR